MASRVISASLTLKDKDFTSGLKKTANTTNDFQRKLKHTGNQVKKFKNNTVNQFKSMALGVGGAIAAAFAVDKIKDFGVSMVSEAASAQAATAQFKQVFADLESSATENLNKIADETGIVPNRLKGSFTQMAAFAKTTGASTADALALSERATLAAADSAAFYDKSIEEVTESLQSYLKGNYENDSALGISSTETTRNAAANELYGKSFKDLSEAQKQLTLLQMVEDGNKLSGALGQASRESDSLENQTGNLKQAWTDFKAIIGEPLLEPAIKGIKGLSERIQEADTEKIKDGMKEVGETIKDVAVPAFEGLKTGIKWVIDNKDTLISAAAGIVGAITAFKVITSINSAVATFNTLMVAYRAGTLASTAAQMGLNTAMLASPLTWIAVGIGLVIAAGILLYKNWDTVKEKAQALWDKLKNVWSGIKEGFSEAWEAVKGAAETAVNGVIGKINDLIETINKIPGVDVPLVAKVDWTEAEIPEGATASASYAVGTNRVPRDMIAKIHQDEMIIPARQSENLRRQGVTIDNIDDIGTGRTNTVTVRNDNNNQNRGTTVVIENLNAKGITANEVVNELVPQLKLKLANL